MPAFTKGKWVDCGDCTVGVEGEDGFIKCWICECVPDYTDITEECAEANTRLIAEAPVMYDLLGKAFDALPNDHPLRYDIDACLCLVEGTPVPGDDY